MTILRRSRPTRSIAYSSTRSRRAMPRAPAVTASPSTGRSWKNSPRRNRGSCPAGFIPKMSPRRLQRRMRRASMSPPGSKARRAGRTLPASTPSSAPCATTTGRAAAEQGARRVNIPAQPNTYRSGPDERGHFGIYGGRFVAETLMPLVLDLEAAYEAAKSDPAFQAELTHLNTHYTGRPSPLYFAERLTEHLREVSAAAGPERRRKDLFQARRAQSHRLAQDQQLPRPDPSRPAHGQDPHHRRDRRRPARRRRRDGLRALRLPASSTWARPTSSGRSRTSFA